MRPVRRVRARLATRLLLWTIPIALVAIALLGSTAYLIARRQILENVNQAVVTIRDEAALGLSAYMRQRSRDIEMVAESPLFADYFNNRDYGLAQEAESYRREMERYLLKFVQRTPAYGLAGYVDERGKEACRIEPSGARRPSAKFSPRLLAAVRRVGAEGIYRTAVRDVPGLGRSMFYGRPLFNAAGEFRGAVFLEAGIEPIEGLLRRVNVGPSSWVALRDESGRVVLGREPPKQPGWIVSGAPVPGYGGTVVVVASEADFLQPLAEIKLLAGGLGLLCGLLVAAAIYTRVRALTEPLGRLVEATKRISAGRLGERVFVRTGDELATLAQAFNEMAKSLQHRERELENRVRQLEALSELETAVLERAGRDEILRTCLESAVRGLGFDRGELYWIEGVQLVRRFASSGGRPGATPPPSRRRRVALSGEDALTRVVSNRRPERIDGRILAPLCGQDRVLGVLAVEGRRSGRELTDSDRDDLMLFANAAGLALENAQLVEELVQSEVRHRQVLDGSADAIAGLDRDLRVVTWNLGAERLFGIHSAVARGELITEVFPAGCRDRVARLFGEAHAKGSVRDAAFEGVELGGRRRDVSASCSPTAGGGWSSVLRDETEKRQLQANLIQAEKLTAVGKLIANVAHELNNPLATIVGYADLFAAAPMKPADLKEALEQVHQSAYQCRGIIESLLLFVRRGDPKKAPVELRDVVEKALKLLEYRLKKAKQVDVTASVPAGLWALASASQLEQVAVNLVSNACDAMAGQGGPQQIWIRATESGSRLTLRFDDSGPGVPEPLREKVFEPFFTTKGEGEGTGLGLAICREILLGHGGDLRCEASPHGGASFVLELPKAAPPKGASRGRQKPPRKAGALRILVVDDEPSVRAMAVKTLEADGHEVESASGREEAHGRLAEASFDAVLADAMLGDGTVLELYDSAGPNRPPFLVMTGNVLDPSLAAELKRRRLPWLPKPFDGGELREALARAVGAAEPKL